MNKEEIKEVITDSIHRCPPIELANAVNDIKELWDTQTAALQNRVKELEGLIEKAYRTAYGKAYNEYPPKENKSWEQFKKEHNL